MTALKTVSVVSTIMTHRPEPEKYNDFTDVTLRHGMIEHICAWQLESPVWVSSTPVNLHQRYLLTCRFLSVQNSPLALIVYSI